jgi:hypothetical protein
MSKEVAKSESGVPAKPFDTTDPFAVFNEVDQESIAIYRPQYHGNKEAGLKKGLWTLPGDEQCDTINAVLLRIANRGNQKWADPYDENQKVPDCFSDQEGWKSIGGGAPETAPTCAECGKANLSDWWQKNKTRPPCAGVSEALWYDHDRERLFLTSYSRKNREIVFKKLPPLYREHIKEIDQSKQITWQFVVTLGIEEDGMAYRPTFEIGEQLDKEMLGEMENLHNIFAESFVKRIPFRPGGNGDDTVTGKSAPSGSAEDNSDIPF